MKFNWEEDAETFKIIALILLMVAGAALSLLGFFVHLALHVLK